MLLFFIVSVSGILSVGFNIANVLIILALNFQLLSCKTWNKEKQECIPLGVDPPYRDPLDRDPPPPHRGQVNASENIIFPQLRFLTVKTKCQFE